MSFLLDFWDASAMVTVTIWMNMPSFYQDELFRALVATGEVDLKVVFARDLEEGRKRLGWRSEPGGYDFQRLARPTAVAEAVSIARSRRDSLHVVNGIWAEPAFAAALVALGALGGAFAIYAESPEPGLRRGLVRRTVRRALGRWVAHRSGGVFAISRFAEDYYRDLGFREEGVFPFGYFRDAPRDRVGAGRAAGGAGCEILYLGQLVHRKGLDVLLDAVGPLMAVEPGLRLSLVGEGPERPALEGRVRDAGLGGRVAFEGVLPFDEVIDRLGSADLLVLPSRWDGWGMVVNEAFLAGVPVIASDRCGASDLIRGGSNGYVFRSEDPADLRGRLAEFLALGDRREAMRGEARRTGQEVTTAAAAAYFVECLKAMRDRTSKPHPPWRQLEPSGVRL